MNRVYHWSKDYIGVKAPINEKVLNFISSEMIKKTDGTFTKKGIIIKIENENVDIFAQHVIFDGLFLKLF